MRANRMQAHAQLGHEAHEGAEARAPGEGAGGMRSVGGWGNGGGWGRVVRGWGVGGWGGGIDRSGNQRGAGSGWRISTLTLQVPSTQSRAHLRRFHTSIVSVHGELTFAHWAA